jgi:hypothetical protein
MPKDALTLLEVRQPTLTIVCELCGRPGLLSASTLRPYATEALENGALNASIRSYLINLINGRVPSLPPDPRDDLLRNLLRDIAIATMAEAAAMRWALPKLNSGRRQSAAWFVAIVMTEYGHKLTERQVRRLIQAYGQGFGARLSAFLLVGAVQQTI